MVPAASSRHIFQGKLQLCSTLFRPHPAFMSVASLPPPRLQSIRSGGEEGLELASGTPEAPSSQSQGPEKRRIHKKGGSLAIHPLPPNCRGGEWLSAEFGRKVTNRLRGWARRRRRSGRYHRRTRRYEKGFLQENGSDAMSKNLHTGLG